MRTHCYFVYILSDRHRGVLYTGVTSNLERRLAEHKSRTQPGFASKYYSHVLAYFEETTDVHMAIAREKQIKGWSRAKKIAVIESLNPNWNDLSEGWSQRRGPADALGTLAPGRDAPAAAPPPDSFAEAPVTDEGTLRRSE